MLNHPLETAASPKLSEVLFERPEYSFASLAAMPSNIEAIEAALMFSAKLANLVAVTGPSGWGKSHLLNAVAYRLSIEGPPCTEPVSVADYLSLSHRMDPSGPLVLDDVQDVMGKTRQKLALRLALERRVRAMRPTILAFTSPKPTRQLKAFLPSARDWTVVTMGEPAASERTLILNQMAEAEGLVLSPRLVSILAQQMFGNGRTLAGALKRLRLSGGTWMNASSTLRALGVLEPFFADNSGWDLKMKILKVADRHRAQFGRVNATDMAIYTMLREAGLAEADIARTTDMSPAEVYQRASRFQKQLHACEVTRSNVAQFVELIVGSLA